MNHPEILTWDVREQPDLNKLATAVLDLSRRGWAVHLTPVEDTGCDEYALIVSDRSYEQAEATEAYLRWREDEA